MALRRRHPDSPTEADLDALDREEPPPWLQDEDTAEGSDLDDGDVDDDVDEAGDAEADELDDDGPEPRPIALERDKDAADLPGPTLTSARTVDAPDDEDERGTAEGYSDDEVSHSSRASTNEDDEIDSEDPDRRAAKRIRLQHDQEPEDNSDPDDEHAPNPLRASAEAEDDDDEDEDELDDASKSIDLSARKRKRPGSSAIGAGPAYLGASATVPAATDQNDELQSDEDPL